MEQLVNKYNVPPLEGNPRVTEAWALTQAALKMKAAQQNNDIEAMLAAARLNWQLWTIIQSELLSVDCPVPADIRQNVLSLANFIDKHTVGFIGAPEARKLDVLISINRELAGGLYAAEPTRAAGEAETVRETTNTSA
jgi:flagellar protein FlaF